MNTTSLSVRFPKQRYFLNSPSLCVSVDGREACRTDFASGLDLTLPVSEGRHSIEVCIDLGLIARKRLLEIDARANAHTVVTLKYSRLWGNFTKRPDVVVE